MRLRRLLVRTVVSFSTVRNCPQRVVLQPFGGANRCPFARELSTLPRELSALPRELSSLPRELSSLPRELSSLPRELSSLPRELSSLPRELSLYRCKKVWLWQDADSLES